MDVEQLKRFATFPIVAFAVTAALIAFDALHDHLDPTAPAWEVWLEVGVTLLAIAGMRWLWLEWARARRAADAARAALVIAHEQAKEWKDESDRWRQEAKDSLIGLSEIIDRQFERWHFTPAEKEVASLLLKGLSHKEAAEVRRASERTVRQQALAIYKKAGLAGRAELAAFFLEDLLFPAKEHRS
jgi:DNA-binding CsgD family transcriptional regulator